jgi:hypothetical protein
LIYEIYEKSGDTEKQITTAEKILFLLDVDYFDILKKLLSEKGEWEAKYPTLRAALSQELPNNLYMQVLNKENDWQYLMQQIHQYPQYVFEYGKQLSLYYPDEIREIAISEIRSQATEASSRPHYRKVCANIKKLSEYAELDDALAIIAELEADNPRRPAMLDELQTIRTKLTKSKKKGK